jgi:hypothetical protein
MHTSPLITAEPAEIGKRLHRASQERLNTWVRGNNRIGPNRYLMHSTAQKGQQFVQVMLLSF